MAGNLYSTIGNQNAADATSILGLESATTIRPTIYYVCFGVAGEATVAADETTMQINRFTTPGTNTAVTPQALDPASPASKATGASNYTGEPTKTSGEVVLQFSHVPNQTTNFQWYAPNGSSGLVAPATANNGLVLLFSTTSNTINHIAEFHHSE